LQPARRARTGGGDRNVKKWLLIGAAVLVVLLAGAVAAYVLQKRYEARDIEGSSTEEFVTTETVETTVAPPGEPQEVVWGVYGYTNERLKAPALFQQRPPYRTIWTFRARALLEFPPVIAYKTAYVANNSGRLFAINVRTGKVRWSFRGRRCTASSPAVSRKIVYQTFMNRPPCNARGGRRGLDGEVVAFNARTGTVRWRRTIGPSESSPAVAGGLVYVGDWRGNVLALDARTGRTRWSVRVGGQVKAGVAISGERLYVGAYDGLLYAFNARTGRRFWVASAQDRLGGRGNFYATPSVAYGRVYVGNTDGKVYSYGATSGKLRWSQSTGSFVYSSPAAWKLRVYAGSHDRHLYCFDAATGRVRWKFRANGKISGSPTVINGLVYFSTITGRTYALEAATGKVRWTWPDGQYTAVVADRRRLYVVGYSKLYAMVRR
jgi:outer membrane protein assembly factor BamB